MTFAPFDPAATVLDEHGNAVRYLDTPLDHKYRVIPPNWVCRRYVATRGLRNATCGGGNEAGDRALVSLEFLAALARFYEAKKAKALALKKQHELRLLAQKSPAHKAALRRILHSMPENSGGREVLASYLQPVSYLMGK